MPESDRADAPSLDADRERLPPQSSTALAATTSLSSALAASRGIWASGAGILAPFGAGCCFAVRAGGSGDVERSERAATAADAAAAEEDAPRRKLWRDPMPPGRRKKPQRVASDETITITFGPATTQQVRR